MEAVTTAITSAGTIISSGWSIISGNPVFLLPIGFSLLMGGVGIAKHLAHK